ncbi:MAG: sigma 54-interacting transcriptional regulator [Myxococcota bacterium]
MAETFRHAPATRPSFDAVSVVVASGEDAGAQVLLDGSHPGRVLVGTSAACTLRLHDPSVSRRHVALELEGGTLRLRDLGSTNGTFVNDVRIVEASVEPPATLRLGQSELRISAEVGAGVEPAPRRTFGRLRGESLAMRRLYPLCERLALSAIPLVIEGETGTGKEALAEAIHEEGPRSHGPFVVFDCTVVPATLMEAELFGHVRGAFTGATEARKGVFFEADGGTLLLDEIGDLAPALQPKLLRAIDRGEARPVGAAKGARADVRIIAATRRDLDREVEEGRFRDDLFHRLAVGRVELPPLRVRRGDVAALAYAFWEELGGERADLPRSLLRRWEAHAWPGNVRELRNAIARRLALGELASFDPVPAIDGDWVAPILALPLKEARQRLQEEFERRYVHAMLERHRGNVTHAAEGAGVARRYFQKVKARSES